MCITKPRQGKVSVTIADPGRKALACCLGSVVQWSYVMFQLMCNQMFPHRFVANRSMNGGIFIESVLNPGEDLMENEENRSIFTRVVCELINNHFHASNINISRHPWNFNYTSIYIKFIIVLEAQQPRTRRGAGNVFWFSESKLVRFKLHEVRRSIQLASFGLEHVTRVAVLVVGLAAYQRLIIRVAAVEQLPVDERNQNSSKHDQQAEQKLCKW